MVKTQNNITIIQKECGLTITLRSLQASTFKSMLELTTISHRTLKTRLWWSSNMLQNNDVSRQYNPSPTINSTNKIIPTKGNGQSCRHQHSALLTAPPARHFEPKDSSSILLIFHAYQGTRVPLPTESVGHTRQQFSHPRQVLVVELKQ